MTKAKKKDDCTDCIHYNCCDDGDNRWDIWCSENPNQKGDQDFDLQLAQTCQFFIHDGGMVH